MILQLDHVQISAPRGTEAQARQFYGELLGLAELPKPHTLAGRGGVWFSAGDRQLHIGVEDGQDNTTSRRHVAFLVDNLDALRTQLETAGYETAEDAPLPGYRRFYARDPFGNRTEFMQRE